MREKSSGYWFGYTLGMSVGTLLYGIIPTLLIDRGRGQEITECPEGYNPIVKVSSADALGALATLAEKDKIQDSFAHGSRKADIASLPGELACKFTGADLSVNTYLLPAGLDALQRSSDFVPMSGKLPNGLEWVSAPGK